MQYLITEQEYAAVVILRETGVGVLEAAILARDTLQQSHGGIKRARKCLHLGEQELRRQSRTISFSRAAAEALAARKERRRRTQSDFRYICRRFMKRCPGLARRRVRSIRPEECRSWLEQAFESPSQRRKARAILSGVFSTAVKRGWCDSNPVSGVEVPSVQEKTVPILKPEEIIALLKASSTYCSGNCRASVGMMLYAGIRPHEVARLTWAQVDLRNRAIYIHPRHSKTGGARRVTIHKPLFNILLQHQRDASEKICPHNWLHHWRELRRAAGWYGAKRWPQDALRHTYASYHLSHFHNYAELQCEIGHRDASLLRTRYVDQRGVENARAFWLSIPRTTSDSEIRE